MSQGDVITVVSQRNLLPAAVSASVDRTPVQREYLSKLRAEVNAHNVIPVDNKKTIKYVNGVPIIIFASSNNHGGMPKNGE